MKRLLLAIALFVGVGINSVYAVQIPMHIIDLSMPTFEDDFTLELLDEDGVVVYSVYVPAGTTLIVLPSTLSGDFELRLVADTYYYRGYITL